MVSSVPSGMVVSIVPSVKLIVYAIRFTPSYSYLADLNIVIFMRRSNWSRFEYAGYNLSVSGDSSSFALGGKSHE